MNRTFRIALVLVACQAVVTGIASPALAQFSGFTFPNPFTGDQVVIESPLDPRHGIPAYEFYVTNTTRSYLFVTVEYVDLRRQWQTVYYNFTPGEHAFLFRTHNRYVYVSAVENSYGTQNPRRWGRRQVDLGPVFNAYDVRLQAPENLRTPNASRAPDTRFHWFYQGGRFDATGGDRWEERNPSGTHYFSERQRTSDWVELYDSSRGYTVRLHQDAFYIIGGFPGQPAHFSNWTKYKNGNWGFQ